MTAATQHSPQLTKNVGNERLPHVQPLENRDADRSRLDATEPAAQPVVGRVIDHVEEGRGRDHEVDRIRWDRRSTGGITRNQHRARPSLCHPTASHLVTVTKQVPRFPRDDGRDVPARRRQAPSLVDSALRCDRDRLIRRKRVPGEEARRVSGQSVDGDHADPGIGVRELPQAISCQQIASQRADRTEGFRMVEGQQVGSLFLPVLLRGVAVHLRECPQDIRQGRWGQPGADENPAERVDVAPNRCPAEQRGFDQGCTASHERVVDDPPGSCEPFDEETRELRLETRPIRNFMETVRGALAAGPELVGISRHTERASIVIPDRCRIDTGSRSAPHEVLQLPIERGMDGLEQRWFHVTSPFSRSDAG